MEAKSKRYSLNQYLREQRKALGISQITVANKLGVGAQFVSNFELGKCVFPMKHLRKVIRIYGINPEKVISIMLKEQRQDLEKALR